MWADRDERPDRKHARRPHRREETEAGLRNILQLPRTAGRRVLREAMARELGAPVELVAHAAEHRELQRPAEALAGIELVVGIAVLFTEEARDLREADDRIDMAVRRSALAVARERSVFRIDLDRKPGEEVELFGQTRGFLRAGVHSDGLLERHLLLRHHCLQRLRV